MNEILTSDEAAALLRVSQSFLAKARMNGSGPAFAKIGARVVYRREALLRWLTDREHFRTSEYMFDDEATS